MSPRRRILLLAPFPPRTEAVHGGGRVVGHLVAGLTRKHDVRLVCVRGTDELGTEATLSRRCVSVDEFLRPAPTSAGARLRKKARSLRNVFMGLPSWASRSRVPGLGRHVSRVVEEWKPDVVQFEFHVMGQYAGHVGRRAARLLTEHEIGRAAAREALDAAGGFGWPTALLDFLAWRHFEPRVLRRMDAVVVFTSRDKAALEARSPGSEVDVVPLGVVVPPKPLDPRGSPPGRIVYVGNYRHPPNVEAAVRLAREIFPDVRARVPGAELVLVGAHPPAALVDLSGPSVTVTGGVASVEPFLDEAAVVAAPITRGGGMRVKVLEALAAGKAVVATPLALEGLSVADGEEVVVAEGGGAFADALVSLLTDVDRRVGIATAARRWAERELSWEATVSRYEALYDRLLENRA